MYNGNSLEDLCYETEYDITVKGQQKVYCNLSEKENNHFVGKSTGVSLMANPYLVEKKMNGATLVFSKVGFNILNGRQHEYMKKWGEFILDNSLKGKKIFVMGIVFGAEEQYQYYGKDHLVMTSPYREIYKYYDIN